MLWTWLDPRCRPREDWHWLRKKRKTRKMEFFWNFWWKMEMKWVTNLTEVLQSGATLVNFGWHYFGRIKQHFYLGQNWGTKTTIGPNFWDHSGKLILGRKAINCTLNVTWSSPMWDEACQEEEGWPPQAPDSSLARNTRCRCWASPRSSARIWTSDLEYNIIQHAWRIG